MAKDILKSKTKSTLSNSVESIKCVMCKKDITHKVQYLIRKVGWVCEKCNNK